MIKESLYQQFMIPLEAAQPSLFVIDADNGNIINTMAHVQISDLYPLNKGAARINKEMEEDLRDFPWYMNDEGTCLDWTKYEMNKNESFYCFEKG